MKILKKENRIISMNDDLYDSMFLEELEARLETDPIMSGGLINLMEGQDDVICNCNYHVCACDHEIVECDCNYHICGSDN